MDSEKLVIHSERCTGCMSCVLACSLHHVKAFDRKTASVQVSVFGKEREMRISIASAQEGSWQACDYCEGEKEPLCIKYCVTKAIVRS